MESYLYNLRRRIISFFQVNSLSIFIFLLMSTCVSFFIYVEFLQIPLLSKRNILLAIVITGILTTFFEIIYIKFFRPILLKLTKKSRLCLLIISILILILFLTFLSINTTPFYFLYPKYEICIQISLHEGERNSDGLILTYSKNEYRDISFSEFNINGQYELRNNGIYFYPGQSVEIKWNGIVGDNFSITFIPLANNQLININWGNDQIDSYKFENLGIEKNFYHGYLTQINEKFINRAFALPIIFVIVFAVLLGFHSSIPYSSFIISIWSIILLIFWPGIIGDINIITTNELFSGILKDWHPVFYTLFLGGLIKISSTATTLLFIQIIALGLIVGRGFSFLELKGYNRKVLWVVAIVITFFPTNFLSIITLTNDIPYSIALLGLTILIIKIVLSNGKWFEKKINCIYFIVLSLLAILFRYNGIPAIAFSIFFLFLFYPKQRKPVFKIALILTFLIIFINGPLYNLIGVERIAEGQLDNILLHHISAHINQGTPLTKDQESYLNLLYPLGDWDYSCCSNGAMWFKPEFNKVLFHENSKLNRQIILNLFLKNPSVEVNHILCSSDMIWNIPGKCEIKNPFIDKNGSNYYWTRSYFPEYTENSKLPILVKPLAEFIIYIESNGFLSILFWRPAIYTYLAILSTLILYLKTGHKNVFSILSPLLGQSIFLFFFNRIQNFRYQYCAVIIGLFLMSLILFPKNTIRDKNSNQKYV